MDSAVTLRPLDSSVASVIAITFKDCFGWLHESWGDIGVLMCPATGRDLARSDMSLRLLAVELTRSGYPTLRFDYPGTGDSCDLDGDEPSASWLESIGAAAGILRSTGVRRIVFCGVRFGSMLAAIKALEYDDVCAVVLVDPVVTGSSYLRELSIASQLETGAPIGDDAGVEVDELHLADGPTAPLRALSLLSMEAPPARHMLILNSAPPSALVSKLVDRMRALGSEVTEVDFELMDEYDEHGHVMRVSNLHIVGDWLRSVAQPTSRPAWHAYPVLSAGVSTPTFSERPLRFGPSGRLFGMLCRPTQKAESGLVLLIGNAGATSHRGPSRFHVMLARRLAAVGIASLRLDFAGIGESLVDTAEQGTHVYETNRGGDIARAIDALQDAGYRRFAIGGLCSGAFHAWSASLIDDRIEALLMLNPVTFSWRSGQPFNEFVKSNNHSTNFYLLAMSSRRGWIRLLRGELNVSVALRTVRTHAVRRFVATSARVAALLGWPTKRDWPRRSMRRLSKRGTRILLAAGTMDAGLDLLQAHFGRGGRELAGLPGSMVKLLPQVDHSMTRHAMRVKAADACVDFLLAADSRTAIHSGPEPIDMDAQTAPTRDT